MSSHYKRSLKFLNEVIFFSLPALSRGIGITVKIMSLVAIRDRLRYFLLNDIMFFFKSKTIILYVKLETYLTMLPDEVIWSGAS